MERTTTSSDPLAAELPFPILCAAARRAAVIVVGGAGRDAAKQEAVRRSRLELEWTETRDGGTRLVEAVAARVRRGAATAIILVEGAMAHRHWTALVTAARLAGTPVAYAKRGGSTQILRALADIERRLAEQRVGAA